MNYNLFQSIQISLLSALTSVLTSLISFVPTLLGAFLVFIVGVVLANWLKVLVVKVLNLLKLSEMIGSDSVKKFLSNAQITEKIEGVIGDFVRYLVILIFFIAAINLLGLTTVTQVLNGLLAYLPNIFASVLILFAGVLLAGFLEKMVKGSLGSLDLRLSRLMGKFTSYLVVVFAALAAISQLGIAKSFIDTLFIGFVSMLSIALGLAFGLGSKDLVKSVLEDWHKDLKKDLK